MECPTLGKVAAGAPIARPVVAFGESMARAEPEPNPDEFSQGITGSNAALLPPLGSLSDRLERWVSDVGDWPNICGSPAFGG